MRADRIEVQWPSDLMEFVADVVANQIVTIEEGRAARTRRLNILEQDRDDSTSHICVTHVNQERLAETDRTAARHENALQQMNADELERQKIQAIAPEAIADCVRYGGSHCR